MLLWTAMQAYAICRDANFADAEIVRSYEPGGHGPRAGPGGVQEQRHFGNQGKYFTVYLML